MRWVWKSVSVVILMIIVSVAGCGKSPATSDVDAAITRAALDDRTVGVEVTSIHVEPWEKPPGITKDQEGKMLMAKWTARLHLTEAYGYVELSVGDKNVVQTVLDKGTDIDCSGTVTAEKTDDTWKCDAFASSRGWEPILEKAGPITMGYPTFDSNGNPGPMVTGRNAGGFARPGWPLQAVSEISNAIVKGTPEEKQLTADINARRQKAQQSANEAAAAKAQADLLAKQKREEAQRQAAIKPWFDPFRSKSGAVITTDAGNTMGSLLSEIQIDEAGLKITGKGIDLRQMPFREFTFEATMDAKNLNKLTMNNSLAPDPMVFAAHNSSGLSRNGTTLAPLDEAGRASLDSIAALGEKLASATPLEIVPEILDATAATARQPGMQTTSVTGTTLLSGKKNAALATMFSGDISKNKKVYRWTKGAAAIRLDQPAQAGGLYIEGSTAASDGFAVIINGIHKIKIDSIPKAGGALIKLPADLQLLDLRFETDGNVQVRGIMLVK